MPTSVASASTSSVRIRDVAAKGATHTFEVLLADGSGTPIANADLDLGGLGADPDLRVPTTPLLATGTGYRATVRFPADGDWVLVVRVHSPVNRVELFTTKIDGTGAAAGGHGSSPTPSRRAVLAQDPTFFTRYAPGGSTAGSMAGSTSGSVAGHTDADPAGNDGHATASAESVDPAGLAAMLAHALGAAAWMVAVVGLALAGRLGHGSGRQSLVDFIAARYQFLAGGGLLVVVFTGLQNVQRSSPGLLQPSTLVETRTGSAYLATFVFKMLVVVASIVTTWRIGRLLPSPVARARLNRLVSIGSMVNDDPSADAASSRLFRLADANVVFAGAILAAVVVLSQLHHVLH